MKNYKERAKLDVQENMGANLGDRMIMSTDMISDWDKPVATINISVLKKMLASVPKISFHTLRDELSRDILQCNTKDEIETLVANRLDFGKLMKAIEECSDEIRDDSGNCDADAPYVSDHPVNA